MIEFPLITVIVPSYNSPDLLLSLESVLQQDYPRIQLILIDDASFSFPKEEIEIFIQHNRRNNLELLQILVNPENLGTVRSLNLALEHSLGAYIFNLAGDDCFADCRVLSDWVTAFIQTGAHVMTAYRAVYDEQLKVQFKIEPSGKQVRMIRKMDPQALFEQIAKVNFIFGCCSARSAESIWQYGLYDERYRLIEDHPMNLKLLRMGEPIVFFDRIVIKYRGGGTSSPAKYNAVYAQDVDNVLQYDVLPYTRHPIRMQHAYRQWKQDQRLLQRRAQLLDSHSHSRPMWLLIQAWYYLHHPWRTLCRFPAFITKRIKGERSIWK